MANQRCRLTLGLVLLALTLGCSRGDDAGSGDIGRIIASGLYRDYNVGQVPDGQIEIMSGLSASVEGSDFAARRFAPAHLEFLRSWEQRGLLALREHSQSSLEAIGRMGARTFTVTPTEQLRSIADPTLATDGYLMIPLGSVTIEQIVSDAIYQSPALSASEQWRLVLGTYRVKPTEIANEAASSTEDHTYRFKALLKFDPFTNTFTYVAADFGRVGETEWLTQRVQ